MITQSTLDLQVLKYIQETLGFGRVIKQGHRTSRFIVEDNASVALLVALCNGNLIFPTKQSSFALFLEAFNKRSLQRPTSSQSSKSAAASQAVELIPSLVTPAIHDFWLAGITDAEGCFNCG